ncbi:hypothetical protein [Heliophilum fasciatum]|nr:hypothetical protein [Heliophilum fasciatum]MCW2278672.1 hypothetical protein [Heliophilum fasciatum]
MNAERRIIGRRCLGALILLPLLFAAIAGLAWISFRYGPWHRIAEAAPWEVQRRVIDERGGSLAITFRPWQPGEGLLDEQGRYWQVTEVSEQAIQVKSASPADRWAEDDLVSRWGPACQLRFPDDGGRGTVVLITEISDKVQWETLEPLTQAVQRVGYEVVVEDATKIDQLRLQAWAEKGPAAIVRIHQQTTPLWSNGEPDRRPAIGVALNHVRVAANSRFAERWALALPAPERPLVFWHRQASQQHLCPRMLDLWVPPAVPGELAQAEKRMDALGGALGRALDS